MPLPVVRVEAPQPPQPIQQAQPAAGGDLQSLLKRYDADKEEAPQKSIVSELRMNELPPPATSTFPTFQQNQGFVIPQSTMPPGLGGNFSTPGGPSFLNSTFDVKVGKEVSTYHKGPVCGVGVLEINDYIQVLMKSKYNLQTLRDVILITASFDKTITTYDLDSGERLFSLENAHAQAITILSQMEITQFELQQLQPKSQAYGQQVSCPKFGFLTGCAQGIVKVWDIVNAVCLKTFPVPPKVGVDPKAKKGPNDLAGAIYDIVVKNRMLTQANGSFLVRLIFVSYEDKSIRAWNFLNGVILLTIRNEEGRIASLDSTAYNLAAFSNAWGMGSQFPSAMNPQFSVMGQPVGQSVMGSQMGANLPAGQMMTQSMIGAQAGMAQGARCTTILFGAGDGSMVKIWETTKGSVISTIPTTCRGIACIRLSERIDSELEASRDISTLLVVGEQLEGQNPAKIEVFNWITKQKVANFDGAHLYAVNSLSVVTYRPPSAIEPEIVLFSGSNTPNDQALRVWNIKKGKKEKEFMPAFSCSWHSIGQKHIPAISNAAPTVFGSFSGDLTNFRVCFFQME
eukprot:TRINITY_DN7420_c0_g1_i3.p1 TRINITY_DN7420_c0_g1~~TRINITY_DN7420_c0_g1_i3.p1  ORF type:complete len:569 (-),score=170.72 TRINITY_DN7420_c0_g1_i3:157-1863(-)